MEMTALQDFLIFLHSIRGTGTRRWLVEPGGGVNHSFGTFWEGALIVEMPNTKAATGILNLYRKIETPEFRIERYPADDGALIVIPPSILRKKLKERLQHDLSDTGHISLHDYCLGIESIYSAPGGK